MSCQKWNIGDDEEAFNNEWDEKTEPDDSNTPQIFSKVFCTPNILSFL